MKCLRPLLHALFLLGLTSCLQIGPAHPEQDGRAYLEKKGVPEAVITAVVTGAPLAAEQVKEFSSSRSLDVRHLIARNPHLTPEQIAASMRDPDDFVRSGAAANPGLTTNQFETLILDASHTVVLQLAGNAALTDDQLLRVHRQRNPGLVWFALNPNCPVGIRDAITASTDTMAQHWLKTVDEWKANGTYTKGPDGRWQRP